jgi:hypothetical protein
MADINAAARNTLNVSQSIRKVDMQREILELEQVGLNSPLAVLLGHLNSEPTVNPEYSWQEDKPENRFSKTNGTVTNVATTVNVSAGTGVLFGPQDMFKNTRTGEVVQVSSVATDALTVVRNAGAGGTGIAMNDLDELLIIGSAAAENATSKGSRTSNPVKVLNWTQIFRKPWEASETWRHSDTFTAPPDWARTGAHMGLEHMKDMELSYWFGTGGEVAGGPLRTTKGVVSFIVTNVIDGGGTLTEPEFFSTFSPAFRFGNQDAKTLFASRLLVDVINGFPRGKLEVIQSDNDQTYGVSVMKYRSPHGQMNVVTHNLFEGQKYGGFGVLLDLSKCKKRYLANGEGSRDTHIRENIQPPDQDGRKDEYLTEAGTQVGLEKAHALIQNVSG